MTTTYQRRLPGGMTRILARSLLYAGLAASMVDEGSNALQAGAVDMPALAEALAEAAGEVPAAQLMKQGSCNSFHQICWLAVTSLLSALGTSCAPAA
jgi:hypothetical protein